MIFPIRLIGNKSISLTLKYIEIRCNIAKIRPIWQTTEITTIIYGELMVLTETNSNNIRIIAPYMCTFA